MAVGTETLAGIDAASLSDEERIRLIHKNWWIGYSRATRIRDQMERVFNYPKTHRMPNLAIIGESNSGKTMLLKNFCKRHGLDPDKEITIDLNDERARLPLLFMETPPRPDEGRFYRELLGLLSITVSHRESPSDMFKRLRVVVRNLKPRAFLLDEFNNALGGSPKQQRSFLNAIRYVGNQLKIPIIAAGIPEALAAIQSDPQLANRFEPAFLPKWKHDAEFASFLMSAEKLLLLRRPSNLVEPRMAQKIVVLSEGILGEVMDILRRLAEHAIRTKEERITSEMLTLKHLHSLGWTEPSKRMVYPA